MISLAGVHVTPLDLPDSTAGPALDASAQPRIGSLDHLDDGVDDADIDALLARIRG